MINKLLLSLWFNENEVVVYSEILSIWSCAASTISSRTKINKSTVRYICQWLEKKGLLFSIKKDWTYIYTAESPSRLHNLLEKEKLILKEKEKNIEKSIKYFESIKNNKAILPKVSFFEWKEWLEKLYNQILDFNKPIDSFEDKWEMVSLIPACVDNFVLERKKRKIYNRVICPSNNPINIESKEELRSVKMLQDKDFPFTGDIKICWDHVSIMSFKENSAVAVSIKDEDIADNFRVLFNYFWNKL